MHHPRRCFQRTQLLLGSESLIVLSGTLPTKHIVSVTTQQNGKIDTTYPFRSNGGGDFGGRFEGG